MILALLVGLAHGASLDAQLGLTTKISASYTSHRGPVLALSVAPSPTFAFRGEIACYPDTHFANTELGFRLLQLESISYVEFSRMHASGAALFAFYPFKSEREQWTSRAGFSAGMGAVFTSDYLGSFEVDVADGPFIMTATQLHGTLNTGFVGDVHRGRMGVAISVNRMRYIETFYGTLLEYRDNVMFSLALSARFSPP